MGVTIIKKFMNMSDAVVVVNNVERGHQWEIRPHGPHDPEPPTTEIWIPWCVSQVDFDHNHYMKIRTKSRTYWVWQSKEGGEDRVRYNTEGRWTPRATSVPGHPWVDGDRRVYINPDESITFEKL